VTLPEEDEEHIDLPKLLPVLMIICLIVFVIAKTFFPAAYNEAIDPVDSDGYTPLAQKHLFSLVVFYVLAFIGCIKVWRKGRKLPPLALALSVTLMLIWCVISIFMLIQVSSRNDSEQYIDPSIRLLLFMPIAFQLLMIIILLLRLLREGVQVAEKRQYKNRFLNYLNQQLASSKHYTLWLLILLLPVLILILLFLMLFGQEPDSLVKVFTETTTWQLSQKAHPPYLDHQGHYLCTVAACGTPTIVKPIHLGSRHGHTIIVNRQLQIANAFEELLQEHFKRTHKVIRLGYDQYGYNLSKKIITPAASNLTYILMKPIEWGFLIVLNLFCLEPEKKIAKQYR